MGLFEQFPYTNFHGVNLKWILDRMVEFETRLTTAEGKISSLEDRMDTAESDIDALEGRMDTAEDDIDALEGRMDTAEDDIVSLETRMTEAEGDIDALEGRMDTAEDDIDALEGRMDTAEDDIVSLETRMTEAEGDIDDLESCCTAMQSQVPSATAGDAGKVLTSTGAGTAVWRTPLEAKVYRITSSNYTTPPDPSEIKQFYNAGFPVVLQLVGNTNICYNLYLYEVNPASENVARGNVSFPDPQRMAAGLLANWLGQTAPTDGHVDIQIRKTNSGTISWWIGSIAA